MSHEHEFRTTAVELAPETLRLLKRGDVRGAAKAQVAANLARKRQPPEPVEMHTEDEWPAIIVERYGTPSAPDMGAGLRAASTSAIDPLPETRAVVNGVPAAPSLMSGFRAAQERRRLAAAPAGTNFGVPAASDVTARLRSAHQQRTAAAALRTPEPQRAPRVEPPEPVTETAGAAPTPPDMIERIRARAAGAR